MNLNFYKRNQVEDAIALAMDMRSAKEKSDLRTRVKRLLDIDRTSGRNLRSSDPERSNYAFYSKDSPGKGYEVIFSDYEAFALQIGLRMLRHNWPQGFVVSILRRIRPELEQKHRQILCQNPNALFSFEQDTSPGSVPQTNANPQFLLIVSEYDNKSDSENSYARLFQDQASAFKFQLERSGRSCTWLELVTPAFVLRRYLQEAEPRKRGRSG